jgi:UDP-glucuronate 4-epimerase
VVNLANSIPTRLRDMIQVIEQFLGKAARIVYCSAQPGDMADVRRYHQAGTVLGYRPAVRLEDGIRRFVEWRCSLPKVHGIPDCAGAAGR